MAVDIAPCLLNTFPKRMLAIGRAITSAWPRAFEPAAPASQFIDQCRVAAAHGVESHHTRGACMETDTRPKPFYKSLYLQVIAAIVIGALLGHFYPHAGEAMKPLSTL